MLLRSLILGHSVHIFFRNSHIYLSSKKYFSVFFSVCIKLNLRKYALPCHFPPHNTSLPPSCCRGPVKDISYLHLLNRTEPKPKTEPYWAWNSQLNLLRPTARSRIPGSRSPVPGPNYRSPTFSHSWQRFLLASAFVACPKSFGLFNF